MNDRFLNEVLEREREKYEFTTIDSLMIDLDEMEILFMAVPLQGLEVDDGARAGGEEVEVLAGGEVLGKGGPLNCRIWSRLP